MISNRKTQSRKCFKKSLKIDIKNYKKEYTNINKKKVLKVIFETLIGSGSTIGTSTVSIINPSKGIALTSSTALLTSTAILITNEFIPKSKLRFTKLRDWINFITLLYE